MKKSNSKNLSAEDIKEIAHKKIVKIRKEMQFLFKYSQTIGITDFKPIIEFDTIIYKILNKIMNKKL